jgi:hypothetical protein
MKGENAILELKKRLGEQRRAEVLRLNQPGLYPVLPAGTPSGKAVLWLDEERGDR